jgi:hypothetical protein
MCVRDDVQVPGHSLNLTASTGGARNTRSIAARRTTAQPPVVPCTRKHRVGWPSLQVAGVVLAHLQLRSTAHECFVSAAGLHV